jgi:hypothetical protein
MSNKIKLVCNNESCINKSIVYRRFDRLKEYRCKLCDWLLVVAKQSGTYDIRQDQKAKEQLKEFNNNV